MADLRPFRGVRYQTRGAGDADALVSPPYDVIPDDDLELYRSRSPYNVVRLIRPGQDYEGASAAFQAWLAEGVLSEDAQPSLYVHEVAFDGLTRRDLMGALRLEDYEDKVVLPHELTHRGPKEDRLALLRATGVAMEPLWLLYDAAGSPLPGLVREAAAGPPDLEFEGADGRHRLWVVGDTSMHRQVAAALAGAPLLIADGHHRYETALLHSKEVAGGADAASRFTLALLTALDDPGLKVLPTHRVMRTGVRLTGGEPAGSLEEVLGSIKGKVAAGHYAAGAYQVVPLEGEVAVVELHRQVIDNILAGRPAEETLLYTRDGPEAVRWVDGGRGVAAFFLDAPDLRQVLDLARRGTTMPQKSTYFHPKPPSGMVFMRIGPDLRL
ncbi:MAG: DUF1015 family protein [Candidatus Dormibacterales bacterium]